MSLAPFNVGPRLNSHHPYLCPPSDKSDPLIAIGGPQVWRILLEDLTERNPEQQNFAPELERTNAIYIDQTLLRGEPFQLVAHLDSACKHLHWLNRNAIAMIPDLENTGQIDRIFRQFVWISRSTRIPLDQETSKYWIRSLSNEVLQDYLRQYIESPMTENLYKNDFRKRLERPESDYFRTGLLAACVNPRVVDFIVDRALEEEALKQLRSVSEIGQARSVVQLLIDAQLSNPSLPIRSFEGRMLVAQEAENLCGKIFRSLSATDPKPLDLFRLKEKIYRLVALLGINERAINLFNELIYLAKENHFILTQTIVWTWLHTDAVTLERLNTFFEGYATQFNASYLQMRLREMGSGRSKSDLLNLLSKDEKRSMMEYIGREVLMKLEQNQVTN